MGYDFYNHCWLLLLRTFQARASDDASTVRMKRASLVKAGEALSPDAFMLVLDGESSTKDPSISKGPPTALGRLAGRAKQFEKGVSKADGHLKRLGDENDQERWVSIHEADKTFTSLDVIGLSWTIRIHCDSQSPVKRQYQRAYSPLLHMIYMVLVGRIWWVIQTISSLVIILFTLVTCMSEQAMLLWGEIKNAFRYWCLSYLLLVTVCHLQSQVLLPQAVTTAN